MCGAMAGGDNTKKLCGFNFHCGPSKNAFFFGRGWGSGVREEGRKDMNQQKHTKNGVQHRIFCHFGLFLPFYPTNNHKNKNF